MILRGANWGTARETVTVPLGPSPVSILSWDQTCVPMVRCRN
jgi:hypothetical protein